MYQKKNASVSGFLSNLTRSLVFAVLLCQSVGFAGDQIHYQRLLSFGSSTNDGVEPLGSLLLGSDSALYGTTYRGGRNGLDTQYQGFGTIFRLNKDGSGYEILHQFGSVPNDGVRPWGPLIEASDGMLYGTTVYGGGTNRNGDSYGTIFRMSKEGTDYTVLYSLNGTLDGKWPTAQVIEASNGRLYGAARYGGLSELYFGTVFGLDKDGSNFRVLHSFGPNPGIDGLFPGPLLEASDGVLYGTTTISGNSAGTVFKINKDGTGYAILHRFDGDEPFAQLTQGSDGALYGSSYISSAVAFKLNTNGSNYRLLGIFFEGGGSLAKLIKGRDGALYGTQPEGGFGLGSVFRINEDGTDPSNVYRFSPTGNDGSNPRGLILGPDRALYGIAFSGGEFNGGTVYRLFVNRAPIVQLTNRIVSADNRCAADVSVDNGSYDPEGDAITLLQTPPGPYPLGTNRVTLTVTDSLGASNTAIASVVVLDTTAPEITCSTNMTVEFANESGVAVTYSTAAVDFCDPNPQVSSEPPSGSIFPIGVTQVQIRAVDASSNAAICSFAVTVVGARGVKGDVLSELTALRDGLGCGSGGGVNGNVCSKLGDAIEHLANSLQDSFWIDETHVARSGGKQVFQEDESAINNLCQLLNMGDEEIPASVVQGLIDRITRADRLLASVAIREAAEAGMSAGKIEQADKLLARGDTATAGGNCGGGIENFAQAWKLAVLP